MQQVLVICRSRLSWDLVKQFQVWNRTRLVGGSWLLGSTSTYHCGVENPLSRQSKTSSVKNSARASSSTVSLQSKLAKAFAGVCLRWFGTCKFGEDSQKYCCDLICGIFKLIFMRFKCSWIFCRRRFTVPMHGYTRTRHFKQSRKRKKCFVDCREAAPIMHDVQFQTGNADPFKCNLVHASSGEREGAIRIGHWNDTKLNFQKIGHTEKISKDQQGRQNTLVHTQNNHEYYRQRGKRKSLSFFPTCITPWWLNSNNVRCICQTQKLCSSTLCGRERAALPRPLPLAVRSVVWWWRFQTWVRRSSLRTRMCNSEKRRCFARQHSEQFGLGQATRTDQTFVFHAKQSAPMQHNFTSVASLHTWATMPFSWF